LDRALQVINAGAQPDATPMPDAKTLDYVTGASLVATRQLIEASGQWRTTNSFIKKK
jgi:hypothetical protein